MAKFENKKAIFVIGPPTGGKGTQSKRIAKETGFYHFVTSTEGKKVIDENKDDPETLLQKEAYARGDLWEPKWLIGKVQKGRTNEILSDDRCRGILYDGSPRTTYEAENFVNIVVDFVGKENFTVVVINIPDDEIRKRVSERLVCSKNESHMISTRFSDLGLGDKCPECDGVLQKRDLDSKTDARISEYNEKTLPGINYLREKYPKNILEIDGMLLPNEVWEDIKKKLMPRI